MNKTVVLVNEWAAFEKQFPDGSLQDFCRHYLQKDELKQKKKVSEKLAGGVIPPLESGLLLKMMARLVSVFNIYHRAAVAGSGLSFPDGYFYLNALNNLGEIKKTDLINYLLVEYTTGMTAIDKLLKEKLIDERTGDTDKRIKLIKLTEKGGEVLRACYKNAGKPGEMIFHDLSADQIRWCIHLLANIEIKHTQLAIKLKHKDFESLYQAALSSD